MVLALLGMTSTSWSEDDWKSERRHHHAMRDGKTLAADLYLPGTPGKYPVVLVQTPYNKKTLGVPFAGSTGNAGEAGRGAFSGMRSPSSTASVTSTRSSIGAGSSAPRAMEGVDRLSWRRGLDGYDCVEWLASQSFCDGKVGTWGGSALGIQRLDTASERPPHLVCCVPLIASMGQSYEHYYEGGVLLESHAKRLDDLGFGVSTKVRAIPLPGASAWKVAEKLTYHPERIDVPCLMITGWWDNFPDAVVKTFDDIVGKGGDAARKHSRLIIGPWDRRLRGDHRARRPHLPGRGQGVGRRGEDVLRRLPPGGGLWTRSRVCGTGGSTTRSGRRSTPGRPRSGTRRRSF